MNHSERRNTIMQYTLYERIHFSVVSLMTGPFIEEMVKDEVNFESYMTNELQRVKRDMSVYYTTIFKMKKHETNVQKAIGILKAANIKFPVPPQSLGEILTDNNAFLKYTELYHKYNCLGYIKWFVDADKSSLNLETSLEFCLHISKATVNHFRRNFRKPNLTFYTYKLLLARKETNKRQRPPLEYPVPPKKRVRSTQGT